MNHVLGEMTYTGGRASKELNALTSTDEFRSLLAYLKEGRSGICGATSSGKKEGTSTQKKKGNSSRRRRRHRRSNGNRFR